MSVLTAVTDTSMLQQVASILGLALLAGGLSLAAAAGFRWYANQRAPLGLSVLVGLGAIAAVLNTQTALGQVIDNTGPFSAELALFQISAFVVGAFASAAGQRAGDRLVTDIFGETASVDRSLSRVVEAVGRVISVDLPKEIEDIDGYDPVAAETKSKLAGQTLTFPRRLTVAELRERLVTRIETDYGVGHVDIDITADGDVEYLALGQRAAGIGPTLSPKSAAVAVRADPAYAASAGDIVQVWRGDGSERVCTAELRGTAGDVVTLAVDAVDARALDRTESYRLVTLSADARADREFASLLRAADETMAAVTVESESALVGTPLGALDVSVIAVGQAGSDQRVQTLPGREHVLAAGETLYVIGTPDALRKLENAGRGPMTETSADAPSQ